MKKISLVLLVFFIFSFIAIGQTPKYKRIKVFVDKSQIQTLVNMGIDMETVSLSEDGMLILEINDADVNKIQNAGFVTEIIIPDMEAYYVNRFQESIKNKDTYLMGSKDVPVPANFNYGTLAGFLTYDEMLQELDSMALLYPTLVSAKQYIDTTKSIEGRYLYYVKISDNPNIDESEPEVFYNAMTHAREPASMMQQIFYMWYLLENYNSNPFIQSLVNSTEMYFAPCVNPDGYIYNETSSPSGGGMWRKNRRNNGDGTYGIDLNRNYGYMWGYDNTGSSPNTSSDTYRGTAAFSEPETQAVRNFVIGRDFKIALNCHTYSNVLIYPWGYEDMLTPDSLVYMAFGEFMTRDNHYQYGTCNQTINYNSNGGADDWMYGDQVAKGKIFGFTPEIGTGSDGFWPDLDRIIPLCQDNIVQNLSAAMLAGPYAVCNDASSQLVSNINNFAKFSVKRLGITDSATYTISLIPLSQNILSTGDAVEINNLDILTSVIDSISYKLNTSVKFGDAIVYILSIDNGLYTTADTISKIYGVEHQIFFDPCDSLNNWTTSTGWNTTTQQYVSAPSSITDSPGGNYSSNTNTSITLSNAVNLTGIPAATLSFYAKWDIEKSWDYTQVKISTNNGTSWIPLGGNYTVIGGSNQPNEPLYDGTQNSWIQEEINLNSYANQQIKLRFTLESDGSQERDGFYFDDVLISAVDLTTNYPVIVANTIPDDTLVKNSLDTTYDLSQVFHDPNGDSIILSVHGNSNPSLLNAAIQQKNLTVSLLNNQTGTAQLSIKAISNGSEATTIFNITVINPYAVKDLSMQPIISIYPNPASSFVHIYCGNINESTKATVYNTQGQQVNVIELQEGNNILDIQNISKGIYFIQISSQKLNFYQKIIKD